MQIHMLEHEQVQENIFHYMKNLGSYQLSTTIVVVKSVAVDSRWPLRLVQHRKSCHQYPMFGKQARLRSRQDLLNLQCTPSSFIPKAKKLRLPG